MYGAQTLLFRQVQNQMSQMSERQMMQLDPNEFAKLERIMFVLVYGKFVPLGLALCYLVFPTEVQDFFLWPIRNPIFTGALFCAVIAFVIEKNSSNVQVQKYCWWIARCTIPIAELCFLFPEHVRAAGDWLYANPCFLAVPPLVAVAVLVFQNVKRRRQAESGPEATSEYVKMEGDRAPNDLEKQSRGSSHRSGDSTKCRNCGGTGRGTSGFLCWTCSGTGRVAGAPPSDKVVRTPSKPLIIYNEPTNFQRGAEPTRAPINFGNDRVTKSNSKSQINSYKSNTSGPSDGGDPESMGKRQRFFAFVDRAKAKVVKPRS